MNLVFAEKLFSIEHKSTVGLKKHQKWKIKICIKLSQLNYVLVEALYSKAHDKKRGLWQIYSWWQE